MTLDEVRRQAKRLSQAIFEMPASTQRTKLLGEVGALQANADILTSTQTSFIESVAKGLAKIEHSVFG